MNKNKALESYQKLTSLSYLGFLTLVVALCSIHMAPVWLEILTNDAVYQHLMNNVVIELRLVVAVAVTPFVMVCYGVWVDILFYGKL